MSLEAKIEVLTAAVVALTQALQAQQGAPQAAPVAAPQQAIVPQVVAPVAPAAPVAPVAPAMPALPSFAAPVAAPAPAAAPFSDSKGLVDYVMATYQALGAEKGAQIGNILTALGVGNINDLKSEQYGAFYAAVEALKG